MTDINPFSFARRINRPLILDGAMGSLLQLSGVPSDKKAWMTFANTEYPENVLKIHKDYISAGADIITTNTFRTNPAALSGYSEKKQKELLKSAVSLAKEARQDLPVYIAGSNAPAEDCYQRERTLSQKQLKENHFNHIDLLIDNNVNFILNETQSHFDEIRIISEYCFKKSIPYIMSIYLDENLKLLSGESLQQVLPFIREHGPLSIGINCIPPAIYLAVEKEFNYNWGFYLNCGSGNPEDNIIQCGFSPSDYSDIVRSSLQYFPAYIGACCGSNADHIKKIKEVLDGKN